jgi:hypothetical protein
LSLDLLIYMQEIQYTGNLVIHTQFIMCHLSYFIVIQLFYRLFILAGISKGPTY